LSGYLYLKKRDNTVIIKSKNFPSNTKKYKNAIALIGVGGNLGDSKRRFNHLLIKLKKDGLVKVVATSIIYKNPPFGYLQQPFFYNTLLLVSSNLKPLELLRYTQSVEKHFKRKREFKDSPRTLDLDIIFYKKTKIDMAPKLIVPHPHWSKRDSVLVPLKYLKGNRCLKRVLLQQHQTKHIN
jgi:2-amino-4-hydroxy-6-hydroxymethyldihydropteridine diphosphokinase